ncbi:MAG: hypothetical protein ACYTFA_05085 [Planctomycetota bacterium]
MALARRGNYCKKSKSWSAEFETRTSKAVMMPRCSILAVNRGSLWRLIDRLTAGLAEAFDAMFDIDGFVFSQEFLSMVATFITALLTGVFQTLLSGGLRV